MTFNWLIMLFWYIIDLQSLLLQLYTTLYNYKRINQHLENNIDLFFLMQRGRGKGNCDCEWVPGECSWSHKCEGEIYYQP